MEGYDEKNTKKEGSDNESLLKKLKEQVESFLTVTADARALSERDRDYFDHKQWTEEEKKKLLKRRQAPITVNRIKPKVEGMKGLVEQRKVDPKAFPRTPKHTKSAEAVTDALRYVADNVQFDQIKLNTAENIFIEGYGAIITEVADTPRGPEITCSGIPWDRYYFDIHSRRKDFADKRWDGIILWLEEEEVKELFPDVENVEDLLYEDNLDGGEETFDDRPQWVDKKNSRLRVCQHFYIDDGEWKMAYFCANAFLQDPIPSPYLDEFDIPMNPIEAYAANIDRDNNRFGEVRYWIDQQDEINHRRSKFLHINNVRQTAARKGAIADIPAMKREMAKPDGHVEYNGEKGDFEVLGTGEMSQAQFALYQDSKHEMDAVGFNAQLSGERQGDLSGKAISNLQSAATNELSPLYAGIENLEKRVYRQWWFRVRQFWGEDKWIRVTDDQSNLRWVGINQKITFQELLEETINDESLPVEKRRDAALAYQQLSAEQSEELQKIVEVRNPVAELDMDIMIEVSPDTINVQREQFELLANIAQTRPEIPFKTLIRMSTIREKDKKALIQEMEAAQQAAAEAQGQAAKIETAKAEAEIKEKIAKAEKAEAEGQQTAFQTNLLINNPPDDPGVVI